MKKLLFISLAATLVFLACKKINDPGEAPRLFRPAIKDALESNGNWIKASWQAVSGSASYTAEISTDSFKTVAATVKVDTNVHLFENLYWEKLYQVRVRANAADTAKNSKFASLGEIKTARFPTILNIPSPENEVNDNSVKVSWTTSGAVVTEVKILLAADSSVVKTAALNGTDVTNAYKLVSGLNASTSYIIFLYSGTTVRGWANFRTKASLTGALIDLRNITGMASVLADTIPDIASGSIILLKRGETYNISSTISLDKTLTFMAGDDLLNPNKPIINFASNFNITANSNIDSLVFNGLILRGNDFNNRYVFNINTACNIGKVKFENCEAEIFRGVFRTQQQPAIINTFEMNNCVVDSVKDYGVFNISVASSRADIIKITNSTFSDAQKIIVSVNNSVSVLVENCTFNNAPLGGGSAYYIDYSSSSANTVSNGITVNNCIFGTGWGNNGNFNVRDVRTNAATIINTNNNFRTSDHVSSGNDLPNITTLTISAVQLWQDPANDNFKIINTSFTGRNNSGDPRWWPL
ncbi:MAG: DUF5123 domain-containing protein [Chitinophagaceae bacterium]|nr:DUF5123 domain-containing protein [Chitinophagaceae bacterium]